MTRAEARWADIVDRSNRSPLTVREFAHREGLNPNTLAWWRWNLKRLGRTESGTFAEVVVDDQPDLSIVVQVGQSRIHVRRGSDLCLLRDVVEVLS